MAAAPAHPPATAAPHYAVSGAPGATTAIVIAPVSGGRLVADHMLSGEAPVRHERAALAATVGSKPGSCGYAAGVRPFMRLRRFDTNGRLQWTWDLTREKLALGLLDGPAACLSPDGSRLLVAVYSSAQGTAVDFQSLLVANGVIAVGAGGHGFVRPKPTPGTEAFGNPRTTGAVAWRPGRPATLIYETGANTETSRKTSADFATPPAPPVTPP